MNKIEVWLGKHPYVVITVIVCLAVLLIAAMAFHYDLSWIPPLLKGLVTR